MDFKQGKRHYGLEFLLFKINLNNFMTKKSRDDPVIQYYLPFRISPTSFILSLKYFCLSGCLFIRTSKAFIAFV